MVVALPLRFLGGFMNALISLLLPFSFCAALTPSISHLALRAGMLDRPGESRRMHTKPIPRGGGIAVFAALWLSLALLQAEICMNGAIFLGALLVFSLGLADDLSSLGAPFKLFLELGVVCLTLRGAYPTLQGGAFWGGVLWVLALTNAHNMIDGMDGLLSGSAAIEGVFCFLAFWSMGMQANALPFLVMTSACLGFLLYNRHPANIFAGDCGSLFIGFLQGVWSIPLFASTEGIAKIAPLFLFAYPLTELFSSVLRRSLRFQSPLRADRGHLHHCVFDRTRSHRITVFCFYLLAISASALGASLFLAPNFFSSFFISLLTAVFLILMRHFIGIFRQMG